jgi:hypothetical protein
MKSFARRCWESPGRVLVLLGAALQSGCLYEPPEYEAAVRIPPIVNFSQVVPTFSVVQEIFSNEPLLIDVPFRSEDLGEEVLAVMLLDAVPGKLPQVISDQKIHSSTFDDQSRSVGAVVTDFGAAGCHTLTLLLTHVSNTTAFRFQVENESLATRVMWTLAVHAEPGDISLSDCPTQGLTE